MDLANAIQAFRNHLTFKRRETDCVSVAERARLDPHGKRYSAYCRGITLAYLKEAEEFASRAQTWRCETIHKTQHGPGIMTLGESV